MDCPEHKTGSAFPLNSNFVFYYKNVGIFDRQEEWTEFVKYLTTRLPTTFRITPNMQMTNLVENTFETLFCPGENGLATTDSPFTPKNDIQPVEHPTRIQWYPDGLAWNFNCPRSSLSLFDFAKHLKHFLKIELQAGNLSCQEAVSMIPPLLLDVKSNHFVLDMCAAPGSKTSQLIEQLYSTSTSPDGLVWANEPNTSRCYLLSHQIHRLPKPSVLVTKYNAQNFPTFKLSNGKTLLFDRVLCDVPCSSDGTIRKSPKSGSTWSFFKALNLHKLQIEICKRCIELAKVGGRIVYSTCSFNPIENEAVVAEVLRQSGGGVVLMDMSAELKFLRRASGLSRWKVISGTKEVYERYEEVSEKFQKKILQSMFPPRDEELETFNLERCWRIYPHQQNTGGFFIAVFKKMGDISFQNEPGEESENFFEDPFRILPHNIVESIKCNLKSYYGIGDGANSQILENLLFRSKSVQPEYMSIDDINTVYATSSSIFQVIANVCQPIRIVSAGVRLLENFKKVQKSGLCFWRITSDGLSLLVGCITKRVIYICYEDLLLLIEKKNPLFDEFLLSTQNELKKLKNSMESGPLITIYRASAAAYKNIGTPSNHRETLLKSIDHHLMCWLGDNSLSLSISTAQHDSLINLYLTKDYSHKFKPITKITPI